jgi:hypothetical protein
MTLHLLKAPPNPLALQVLGSLPPTATPPVVVFLSSRNTAPPLPQCAVYSLTETPPSQEQGTLTYDQLVWMLFTADRVVTW